MNKYLNLLWHIFFVRIFNKVNVSINYRHILLIMIYAIIIRENFGIWKLLFFKENSKQSVESIKSSEIRGSKETLDSPIKSG